VSVFYLVFFIFYCIFFIFLLFLNNRFYLLWLHTCEINSIYRPIISRRCCHPHLGLSVVINTPYCVGL